MIEYLYTVVGDLWDPPYTVKRTRLLKRRSNSFEVEGGEASEYKRIIKPHDMRRMGLVGSVHVAVLEWRAKMKKRRDELVDELVLVEKALAGPDPEEDF